MKIRHALLIGASILGSLSFIAPTAYADGGWFPQGLRNSSFVMNANHNKSSSGVSNWPVSTGPVLSDVTKNFSETCPSLGTLTQGQNGVNLQDNGMHVAVVSPSSFIKRYGKALYDQLLKAPTFTSYGHVIHSLNGPCGLNYTLDTTLLHGYTYTIKLIQPWNSKGQKSSYSVDYTGQNLADNYCTSNPVENASKVGNEVWSVKSNNSQYKIQFGCAGVYRVTSTNASGQSKTVNVPVYPSGLQKISDVPPAPPQNQGNVLWTSK